MYCALCRSKDNVGEIGQLTEEREKLEKKFHSQYYVVYSVGNWMIDRGK